MADGWAKRFAEVAQLKGALASVALSHPADCNCEVCRAAHGDEEAFARCAEAYFTQPIPSKETR